MSGSEYRQLYNEAGQPLCSRKTKTCKKCGHRYIAKGKPGSEYELLDCPECGFPRGCRQVVKEPGDVCHFHSKDAPKGVAHPSFKNGRHSAYVPKALLPSYEQTMQDNQRLDLSAEIALLDALIDDRLQALDVADSREAWKTAAQETALLEKAIRAQDAAEIAAHVRALRELTSRNRDAAATRDEITELVMKRTRVTDSDRHRLSMLGEFMTRGAVLTLLKYMIESVTENVVDLEGGPGALSRISASFAAIVGQLRSSWTAPRDGRVD